MKLYVKGSDGEVVEVGDCSRRGTRLDQQLVVNFDFAVLEQQLELDDVQRKVEDESLTAQRNDVGIDRGNATC